MKIIDIVKYKDIKFETRKRCVICGKKSEAAIIDMPQFPLTEIYVAKDIKDKLGLVDQGFCFCTNCGHGQIMNVIDVNLQYGNISNYFFRSSNSATARETVNFFINFFNRIAGNKKFKTIVELGCNDLYLLRQLKSRATKLVGIDPILKGNEDKFSEDNIIAIGDFFENNDLLKKSGFDIVICKDVLEHVSDPKRFIKKIVDEASNGTLFFFQFPLLETLLADCRFDQVFHQHLNYFSLKSILYMLDEVGARLLDYVINYNHWGSILIAFSKGENNSSYLNEICEITPEDIFERYRSFKIDMEQTNKRLRYFNKELIYGYGAALMFPVLSYYLENDLSCLKCIIDDDINKDGLYYINSSVPIVHSSKINNIGDAVILLTATFSKITTKSILTKLLNLNPKYIIYPMKTI